MHGGAASSSSSPHSEPKNFDDRASHLNYRGERAELGKNSKNSKEKTKPRALARQT